MKKEFLRLFKLSVIQSSDSDKPTCFRLLDFVPLSGRGRPTEC